MIKTIKEVDVRNLVKCLLEDKSLDPTIVNVNPVVDPSAALTDPSNPNFKPSSRTELQVALGAMLGDVPDEKISDAYDAIKQALETNEEEPEMKRDTKVEEIVRFAVRKMLNEALPKMPGGFGRVPSSLATFVKEIPPDVEDWLRKNPVGPGQGQSSAKSLVRIFKLPIEKAQEYVNMYNEKRGARAATPEEAAEYAKSTKTAEEKKAAEMSRAADENKQKYETDKGWLQEKFRTDTTLEDKQAIEEAIADDHIVQTLALAINSIPNNDAVAYSEIFNATKADLKNLSDINDESEVTTEAVDPVEFGSDFIMKYIDDIELYERYAQRGVGDSVILKTKLFKNNFKDKKGKNFDEFIKEVGMSAKRAMATSLDDEKRGYLKKGSKESTLEDIAKELDLSIAMINNIAHRALGIYVLGLKCIQIGSPLDLD